MLRNGEQAWLLTDDAGNHEFAKVFYERDPHKPDAQSKYNLRAHFGGLTILGADVDETGCTLSWSDGRKSRIHASWYQYTYR